MSTLPLWQHVAEAYALDEPIGDPQKVSIARRRRRDYGEREQDPRAAVELVRDDGVLRWTYTPPANSRRAGRRNYRSLHIAPETVVQRFAFHEPTGVNRVTKALGELDAKLNPSFGLKRLKAGALVASPDAAPKLAGRVLLLVHGTFSSSAMYRSEFEATPAGRTLWAAIEKRYDHVLAFDHPTLAVGAWSNALDLARALKNVSGEIDILCHSRGGLVAAWFMRLVPARVRQVVFVGSPLGGTSLASPEKLRAALDMIATFADMVSRSAMATAPVIPIAAGAAGLARIFGRTLQLGSSLPLVDAAVALVPGLAAQQRIANNLELAQLFADAWLCQPKVLGVGVTFEPDEVRQPAWKFWRRFTQIGDQLKYAAADLVFDAPNDLVVDRAAMEELGARRLGAPEFCDLGRSAETHHCSYFRHAELLKVLDTQLR